MCHLRCRHQYHTKVGSYVLCQTGRGWAKEQGGKCGSRNMKGGMIYGHLPWQPDTPLSRSECCAGGAVGGGAGVVAQSARGSRHEKSRHCPATNNSQIFSPKLPFSQFDRLPLPIHCFSCSNWTPSAKLWVFSDRKWGHAIKLLVTTVGEQKPKAESVFRTTSTWISSWYLSLVTVIVDMEGRGDGEWET